MDLRLGGYPCFRLNFRGDIEELLPAADDPAGGGDELTPELVGTGVGGIRPGGSLSLRPSKPPRAMAKAWPKKLRPAEKSQGL